jgi:hypothetical protein
MPLTPRVASSEPSRLIPSLSAGNLLSLLWEGVSRRMLRLQLQKSSSKVSPLIFLPNEPPSVAFTGDVDIDTHRGL